MLKNWHKFSSNFRMRQRVHSKFIVNSHSLLLAMLMYFRQRAITLVPASLWRPEIKDGRAQSSGGWEIERFNGSCAASGVEKSETKAGPGRLEKLACGAKRGGLKCIRVKASSRRDTGGGFFAS